MYLCICKSVSDRQIRQAVEQGARSFGDLSARFGVGLDCGKCTESINVWLQECLTAATSAGPVRDRDRAADHVPHAGAGREKTGPSPGSRLVCD